MGRGYRAAAAVGKRAATVTSAGWAVSVSKWGNSAGRAIRKLALPTDPTPTARERSIRRPTLRSFAYQSCVHDQESLTRWADRLPSPARHRYAPALRRLRRASAAAVSALATRKHPSYWQHSHFHVNDYGTLPSPPALQSAHFHRHVLTAALAAGHASPA